MSLQEPDSRLQCCYPARNDLENCSHVWKGHEIDSERASWFLLRKHNVINCEAEFGGSTKHHSFLSWFFIHQYLMMCIQPGSLFALEAQCRVPSSSSSWSRVRVMRDRPDLRTVDTSGDPLKPLVVREV